MTLKQKKMKLTAQQEQSIHNYARMGIEIKIVDENTLIIHQKRLINGYLLNQKQLHERARAIFPNIHIKPVVYNFDANFIDVTWITNKMEEFGIKRNDLIKHLAIDKSSLSLYMSGKRKMDKSQKAAFFFYFLTYELNRDFRNTEEKY